MYSHKRGRRERGAYPGNASAGAVDDGFFRGIPDGAQHGVPNLYIRIFMAPTPEVLDMTPAIVRTCALLFLLLRSISFAFSVFRWYNNRILSTSGETFFLRLDGSCCVLRRSGGGFTCRTVPLPPSRLPFSSGRTARRGRTDVPCGTTVV